MRGEGLYKIGYTIMFVSKMTSKAKKKQRKIIVWMKIILYHFQKETKSKFSKKKWDGVSEK